MAATRQDINSSSATHRPRPSLPVYSVDKTTVYDTGSRNQVARVVWVVLQVDPNSPDQIPQPVASTSSVHSAKMLAATLTRYESQAHRIEDLEQQLAQLQEQLAKSRVIALPTTRREHDKK